MRLFHHTGRTNPETMEEGVRLRLSSIPIFVENSEETDTLSFSEENQLCKKWLQMVCSFTFKSK